MFSSNLFLFLVLSLTVNVSAGVYFFLAPALAFPISKSDSEIAKRLIKFYKEKPRLIRKLFRDQIFAILLFSCGLYCSSSRDTYTKPLRNTSSTFLIFFAIYLGNYVFKFFQDFLLRRELPLYKISLLHHFVTATTYGVIIAYRQNSISGVVGLLFEGSVFVFDLNSLLRFLGVSKTGWLVLCTSALRFFLTILLRALCPIALLVITLSSYTPLSLEYVPLGFFFMNIVFFAMINGWHIKVSLEGLKKRLLARRLSYYYSRPRAASDGNFTNGMELNNVTSLTQAITRTALPIIIPSDANFRLSSPVSNVNMNSDEVSNIAVSRHERTLPQINVIINDTPESNEPIIQV